jgi:hypothetical protein
MLYAASTYLPCCAHVDDVEQLWGWQVCSSGGLTSSQERASGWDDQVPADCEYTVQSDAGTYDSQVGVFFVLNY